MRLRDLDNIRLNKDYILRKPIVGTDDGYALFEMYSNQDVARYVPDDFIPVDLDSSIGIVEYYRKAVDKGNMVYWSIARSDNNLMIGLIGFCDIVYHHSRAEISYELNRRYWRRGIASMAVKKVASMMFEDFGMQRIQANVMPDNVSSIALLNKTGFVNEGTLSSYRVFKGAQVDVLMFGYPCVKYFNDTRKADCDKRTWHYIPSHGEIVSKLRSQ